MNWGVVMKRLLDSQRETLIPDLHLSLTCSEPWADLSISLFFSSSYFFTFFLNTELIFTIIFSQMCYSIKCL